MTTTRRASGGRGSNQYAQRGMSAAESARRDLEAVAAAFDPHSDHAWEWSGYADRRPDLERRFGDAVTAAEYLNTLAGHGMTYEDALVYQTHGCSLRRMLETFVPLHNAGFKPAEAIEWINFSGRVDEHAHGWADLVNNGRDLVTLTDWCAEDFTPAEVVDCMPVWTEPNIATALRDVGLDPMSVVRIIHPDHLAPDPRFLPLLPDGPRASADTYRAAGIPGEYVAVAIASQHQTRLADAVKIACFDRGLPDRFPPLTGESTGISKWRSALDVYRRAGWSVDDAIDAIYETDPGMGLAAANPLAHGPNPVVLEGIIDPETTRRSARVLERWASRQDRDLPSAVNGVHSAGWISFGAAWTNDPAAAVITTVFPHQDAAEVRRLIQAHVYPKGRPNTSTLVR